MMDSVLEDKGGAHVRLIVMSGGRAIIIIARNFSDDEKGS